MFLFFILLKCNVFLLSASNKTDTYFIIPVNIPALTQACIAAKGWDGLQVVLIPMVTHDQ